MIEAEHATRMETLIKDQKPTRSRWLKLCALVEEFDDEEDIRHIAERLEPLFVEGGWTPTMRFTPEPWIAMLLEGEPLDWMMITRSLDLRSKKIGYVYADLLSQSPELVYVSHLNLAYNGLQNGGTGALLSTNVVRNLTHLDLAGNSIGKEGVEALTQCEHLSKLTHLDLTGNWVDDDAAALIAECPHLSHLTTLVLRGNPIKKDGAAALARSPHLHDSIRKTWSAG